MAQPLFSISSGAISGAVWEGKFGPQPSIKKAKKTKEGKFEKDENGKQVYTEYYGKADMLHVAFVATALYNFLVNHKEVKTEPEF
jgi:hypothetical protein